MRVCDIYAMVSILMIIASLVPSRKDLETEIVYGDYSREPFLAKKNSH
jgi:hypothetical protein